MESELSKHPLRIFHKRDTIFNGIKCYSFFIKTHDTVSNGNHDYTHKTILIDQKTRLPIYYKHAGAGTAYKGEMLIGRITFHSEKIFDGFNINENIPIIPFVNAGFSHPNTEMLKVGDMAPALYLKDLSGIKVPDKDLKNKVLLVVFGAISCPANPLANPMLDRLNSKFSSEQFSILNIYSNETSEQVKEYIEGNHLNFPIYIGNKMLNRTFKTVGTPNFYLIDKNGNISRAFNGYKASLEQELTGSIVSLLKTSIIKL